MTALLMPPPTSSAPGWIFVIALGLFILVLALALVLDMREEEESAAEEMRVHLAAIEGRDL